MFTVQILSDLTQKCDLCDYNGHTNCHDSWPVWTCNHGSPSRPLLPPSLSSITIYLWRAWLISIKLLAQLPSYCPCTHVQYMWYIICTLVLQLGFSEESVDLVLVGLAGSACIVPCDFPCDVRWERLLDRAPVRRTHTSPSVSPPPRLHRLVIAPMSSPSEFGLPR